MTFSAGHLFSAPAVHDGPFTPELSNHNVMTEEGHNRFARLWGEAYTSEPDLVLVTHQQMPGRFDVPANGTRAGCAGMAVDGGPACPVYAGLVKQAVLGPDGVLRATWWAANNALRGSSLPLLPRPSAAAAAADSVVSVSSCVGACLTSGVWLEGSLHAPEWQSCGTLDRARARRRLPPRCCRQLKQAAVCGRRA